MRLNTLAVTFTASFLLAVTATAADLDGDGIDDNWELRYGMDPGDPSDAILDTDNDGLDALGEYTNGTRPWQRDTDGDWATDGYEVNSAGTNPTDPDTDGDTILDGLEGFYGFNPLDPSSGPGDQDGDGFTTEEETRLGSNPLSAAKVPVYQADFSQSFDISTCPSAGIGPVARTRTGGGAATLATVATAFAGAVRLTCVAVPASRVWASSSTYRRVR